MSKSISPIIHKYTSDNADDIFAIAIKVFSHDGPKPVNDILDMKNVLHDEHTKGWYMKTDKPISFIIFSEDDFTHRFGSIWSYLEFIGTDTNYTGHGYAKHLLEMYLNDNKDRTIYLHVMNNTPHTERLIKWYSKYGFKIVSKIMSGRATTMVRFLDNVDEANFWKVIHDERTNTHIDHTEWCVY